jgi:hypothetical protein
MASASPGVFTGRRKYIPLVVPGFVVGVYFVLAGKPIQLVIGLALMAYSMVLAWKYWNKPEQPDRAWTGRDEFGTKRWHWVAIWSAAALMALFVLLIVSAEIS